MYSSISPDRKSSSQSCRRRPSRRGWSDRPDPPLRDQQMTPATSSTRILKLHSLSIIPSHWHYDVASYICQAQALPPSGPSSKHPPAPACCPRPPPPPESCLPWRCRGAPLPVMRVIENEHSNRGRSMTYYAVMGTGQIVHLILEWDFEWVEFPCRAAEHRSL